MTTGQPFEGLLTPDVLPALMRSTWTWDDRAIRRELTVLLVELKAAQSAVPANGTAQNAEALRSRALVSAADFVTAVLGPQLIATTENPLRQRFLGLALDRAEFARTASSTAARVLEQAERYVSAVAAVQYVPDSPWLQLLSSERQGGLGKAMRAFGYGLPGLGITETRAWRGRPYGLSAKVPTPQRNTSKASSQALFAPLWRWRRKSVLGTRPWCARMR